MTENRSAKAFASHSDRTPLVTVRWMTDVCAERKLKELGHSHNGYRVGYWKRLSIKIQYLLIVVVIDFQGIDRLFPGIPSPSHLLVRSIFSRGQD